MSDFIDDNIISMENFLKDEADEFQEAVFRNEIVNVKDWTKEYFSNMKIVDAKIQMGINSMQIRGSSQSLSITVTVSRRV